MSGFIELVVGLVLLAGVFSPADPGVLERVAERRVRNGWNLQQYYQNMSAVAVEDCSLLGKTGYAIVGSEKHAVQVVDCGLHSQGLIADTNDEALWHKHGILIIYR